MLVPAGQVCIESNNHGNSNVVIAGDVRCNAEMHVHANEVSTRFRQIKCSTIAARLQLAALYAASSSRVPESRNNMTGDHPSPYTWGREDND